MKNSWTKEEIALTRRAWMMYDMNETLRRRKAARDSLGIVVAGIMGVWIAALFILSQW